MTAESGGERMGGWTPARIDLLYRHYAQGMTASQSAEVIGGVSRTAVLSKRIRLGLTRKPDPSPTPLAGLFSRSTAWIFGPPPLPSEPLPDMDLALPAGARPSRLTQRERHECAWPLGPADQPGDYRTLYCCAPSQGRGAYCPTHADWLRRRA